MALTGPGRDAPAAEPGVLVALDAGNSKTDVAVVAADGAVLARTRTAGFRPHVEPEPQALAGLRDGVTAAIHRAGGPRVALLAAYLANADLPEQEHRWAAEMSGWRLADRVVVGNDTLALLRSGLDGTAGVAVVCGAGTNCVGVGADGGQVRFPALGPLTGDWGGGQGLAEAALFHAVRGEDGRGPATALSAAVAGHFGLPDACSVGVGLHVGRIPARRLGELAPLLFAVAAAGDQVAGDVVDRQADEVVAMARVALRRTGLDRGPCRVVLGGGVLAARHPRLLDRVAAGLRAAAPQVAITVPEVPPVVGAVLLGGDRLRGDGGWPGEAAGFAARVTAAWSAGGGQELASM
ncbi:N-acetylglucosamine kinase [Nakamurella endophytica]|uniref:Kinase n=1 Tax=Nakamurella endophytica TaxID=1748367 RepID=A0A917SJJ1_9ACTN|nr:BadF/BadG/BcrA/BcrD ATPase family protein [Nakamurella endophytica]GGL85524.1 kinase [Nakamurella endophytica]